MASEKLTDGRVEAIEPEAADVYLWDTEVRRFGVRVTRSGARIYLIQYRAKGAPGEPSKTRRIIIGQHDGRLWNATKARAAARKLLAPVDLGRDPFAEREQEREAHQLAKAEAGQAAAKAAAEAETRERDRFGAVAERYIVAALNDHRSGTETARHLRAGPIKAWKNRQVDEIRRRDVVELLDGIRDRSAATARLTFSALRGMFGWCLEREIIPASPCDHVKAPPRPAARDRVLSDDELRTIWAGADALGHPFGPILKLLILTGQREAEVAGMAWSEIDLSAAVWTIPKARTKNGREHAVDLSTQALDIIERVPEDGRLLFPRRNAPARKYARPDKEGAVRPVVGFSAAKRLLDGDVTRKTKDRLPTADLAPWRIHDLRRTAATGMASMGIPPHVIERVLNHVSGVTGGLVGVYQRHEYRSERKAALGDWGAHVAAIVGDAPRPSNVIPLRA